jgi:hypothetical protein
MTALLHRSLEENFEDPGNSSTAYFSVPVFLILLRETVEVCLILSTTFAYLSDNKLSHYKKYAIYGTALGSLVFLIIGASLVAVFYTIKNNAFSPDDPHGQIFQGTHCVNNLSTRQYFVCSFSIINDDFFTGNILLTRQPKCLYTLV